MRFFGFLTIVAAAVAAIILGFGLKGAQSAPQEAAIAAIAAAIAVVPYVLFRTLQSMSQADELAAIRQLLEKASFPEKAVAAIELPVGHAKTPSSPETQPQVVTHEAKTGEMGLEGWKWQQMSNGAVRISDPHGANYDYPSLLTAKEAFTWWKGP